MKRKSLRTFFYVIGFLAAGFLWGAAMALIKNTLVTPWLPVAVGLAFASLVFPLAFVRLRSEGNTVRTVVNSVIYFVAAIPLGVIIMLGTNRLTASETDGHNEYAVVTGKFSEEHNQYRTVRNRRVYSGKRTDYYLTLTLPSGHSMNYRVTPHAFGFTRTGKRIELHLSRGCFGYEVIDSIGLKNL